MNKDAYIQPIISFIITDYNIPIQFLRECIESILSLNIKVEEREIILVDDGSKTSPKADIVDYLPYLTYIHQDNQGLSIARNVGVEAAHGKYIQFVDGDDSLLGTYNDCIDTVRANDYDLLMFTLTNQKSTLFPGKTTTCGSGIRFMCNNNLRASACGYIFEKELLKDDLRFSKGILHEDEEFTPLLMLRAKKMGIYSGAAYFYRERENSIVHSVDEEHLNRRFNDFIGIIERLNNTANTLQGTGRKALQRRVNQLKMDYLYNVMTISNDKTRFDEAVNILKSKGLMPLPIKTYTLKYLAFSILMRIGLGQCMLMKYIEKR